MQLVDMPRVRCRVYVGRTMDRSHDVVRGLFRDHVPAQGSNGMTLTEEARLSAVAHLADEREALLTRLQEVWHLSRVEAEYMLDTFGDEPDAETK